MMHSGDSGLCNPLGLEECRILAEALGDAPETVDSVHLLRQGMCKAYVAGDPSRFGAAIVQANDWPTEPTGFGSDPQVLWELLKAVSGWDCILVGSECALMLGEIIEQEMRVGVRYVDAVSHVLTKSVSRVDDKAVRQLAPADLDLLESAPPEFRINCWGSAHALLSEGIVACAISSRQIVATAWTVARSPRHADLGVYTHQDFRCRGLATAAASIVARRVQQAGQTPVWGVGEPNKASLRVALKLGFIEVSRRTYVILEK